MGADEAGAVIPDAVVNRRKKEKTYEYEVKWQFKPMESNCWVEKEILVKMGYLKMVQREDERQAAMAGLMSKQLTQPSIEKHLSDFGVDPESASHTQINQLSGRTRTFSFLTSQPIIWTARVLAHSYSPSKI